MSKKLTINKVRINLNNPEIQGIKTVEDIARLGIFAHMKGEEKNQSEKDLLSYLVPEKPRIMGVPDEHQPTAEKHPED